MYPDPPIRLVILRYLYLLNVYLIITILQITFLKYLTITVPVDLLTSTSTSSPAEYGGTGVGKVDNYGCTINGRYLPEGAKVPQSPGKPCEHCYCIRNMTTCVMQECTLHVDGCTPIYAKDVCCPIRYFCGKYSKSV